VTKYIGVMNNHNPLCKEKPTWCTAYSQYISSTSTCFGHI